MINYFQLFIEELAWISIESAPYLLIGFSVAAILHRYLPAELLARFLGRGKIRSTAMAAALGAPLPLCSCSVVPTALALRKKGASRGATLSFFISTPETGVDSILLTYGLLGPVLAVARPLAAILSAFTAGLLLECLPGGDGGKEEETPVPGCEEAGPSSSSSSCCGHPKTQTASSCCGAAAQEKGRLKFAWARGLGTSFFTLFDEIAIWIAIGLLLSALVGAFLPTELLESSLGRGWSGMGLAILVGLPIYVCATASTPLAAVMIGKGISVGAALVFLLVGPATNIGTVTIVGKILGKRAVASYLVVIVGVAVIFGMALDTFFPDLGENLTPVLVAHEHDSSIFSGFFAAFLWILLIWRSGKKVASSAKRLSPRNIFR